MRQIYVRTNKNHCKPKQTTALKAMQQAIYNKPDAKANGGSSDTAEHDDHPH